VPNTTVSPSGAQDASKLSTRPMSQIFCGEPPVKATLWIASPA
jgi:hypothetical protein